MQALNLLFRAELHVSRAGRALHSELYIEVLKEIILQGLVIDVLAIKITVAWKFAEVQRNLFAGKLRNAVTLLYHAIVVCIVRLDCIGHQLHHIPAVAQLHGRALPTLIFIGLERWLG